MSERYGAMIVGCGRIAGGYNHGPDDEMVLTHALAYRRHPRFDLVAGVDVDEAARTSFAERWGPLAMFSKLDQALDAGLKIDVVSVCVSNQGHADTLLRLAASPVKAVFAEKPLGGEPDAARQIVDRFASVRKPLAVAFLRRWDRTMTVLREEISRGEWGAVRAGVVVYGRGILNNGTHAIDLLHYLLGTSLQAVAVTGHREDGVPDDPTVDAVLATATGERIHLVAADGRDHALFEITLVFARGVVSIEEGGLVVRRRPAEVSKLGGVLRPGKGSRERAAIGESFVHALDDLVAAIEVGRAIASDGNSALPAIALAASLRAAVASEELSS